MPLNIVAQVELPDFRDRPRKQGDILRTAEELFMKFGYLRITVEEISREAGVSKGTFYKYYRNKFALVEDYLQTRMALGMDLFHRIQAADAPVQEKMKALIAMKESAASQTSPIFIQSLLSGDEQLKDLLDRWQKTSLEALRGFFQEGQQTGEINPEFNVDYLVHVWGVLSADIRREDVQAFYAGDMLHMTMDVMNFLFYGTTGHPAGTLPDG